MRAPATVRVRYLITILVFVSSCVSYMNRTNLNIAIVDMVDKGKISSDEVGKNVTSSKQYCLRQQDRAIAHNESSDTSSYGQRFDWSDSLQGQILGSFYYSYVLFQMPTGILTEKFGGKWIIAACLLASAVCSLLTPIVASLSAGALIALRVLLGLAQAGMFPAGFGLLCQWMPLRERSTAFALLNAGGTVGSSIPDFISGPLIHQYGWPSMFYVPGIVSIVTFIIFCLIVHSKPEDSPFVSAAEIRVIREEENSPSAERSATPVDASTARIPWFAILTNKSVLTLAFYQFCTFWILTIWGTSMPLYLDQILGFDVAANGVINGVLQWLQIIPLTTMGFISEIVIIKGWLSRTRTRKVFSLITGAATGICVIFVPAVGCDTTGLIALIFVGSFLCGFTSASDTPVASEMTHNFPAAVFAFQNMVSTAAGFVTPAVVGAILQSVDNLWTAWSIVFFMSGGLMIASNIIFIIFVTAERQKFDFVD